VPSSRNVDWRPGRVYFLTILEPSRDDRTPALTARSASHLPQYGAKESKINLFTAQAAPRTSRWDVSCALQAAGRL
jgi:hypothetical protein